VRATETGDCLSAMNFETRKMESRQSEWYMTKTFRQTNYSVNDGQRIGKTVSTFKLLLIGR
jgi:hypothetical protein